MEENELQPREEETSSSSKDYCAELSALVTSTISPKALADRLTDYHAHDIAATLPQLDSASRAQIYRVLDAETLADILENADDPALYLGELSLRKRTDVLSDMDVSYAVDYLKGLERGERSILLDLLPSDTRKDISLLLSFDEDEIGSIISTNYIEISSSLSVKDAMHALVKQAAENDNISTLYVVDENHLYYGAIDLKDLIIARETTPLSEIIATQYPYLYAHEAIADCVDRIKKYSEDSIPVLDDNDKLIGVITAEDVIRIVDDEMGEDYAMFAGLTAEEDLHEPVRQSIAKRLPWLFTLLGLGLIVSAAVGVFESVIASLPLVICFQSLILDMAGNVGTQSLAVTIRVLSDAQLEKKQKFLLVFKEARVGLTNGLILGSSSCLLVGLYIHFFKAQPFGTAYAISGCIGVAMLVAMLLSAIVGTVIPLFFKRIHIDPAVASGPLITTINDLVAVVSYYGLTYLFLLKFLHLS